MPSYKYLCKKAGIELPKAPAYPNAPRVDAEAAQAKREPKKPARLSLVKKKRLFALMKNLSNAAFACGDHKDTSPNSYTPLHEKFIKAEKELTDFIDKLVAEL